MHFVLSSSVVGAQPGGGLLGLVILLGVIMFGGRFLLDLSKSGKNVGDCALPYRARGYLFSKAERSFYEVLRRIVEPDCQLFAKVRLADIVIVPKGTHGWQGYFNKVQSKHVDFVICEKSGIRILAVVELDDSSHSAVSRQERDAFVNKVLHQAEIPIIRFKASSGYSPSEVREALAGVLGSVAKLEASAA